MKIIYSFYCSVLQKYQNTVIKRYLKNIVQFPSLVNDIFRIRF